jgi:putative transferase (TIGR04331 family)
MSYLENFDSIKNISEGMPWPTKPEVIFTANNFDFDEIFKIYTAEKSIKGALYATGQHGGVYGTYKFVNNPSIEELTSDYFLTWGHSWDHKKHIPCCILNSKYTTKVKHKKNGAITLIEMVEREKVETIDTCFEFEEYFNIQKKFVASLNLSIKKKLLIRLSPHYESRNQSENIRWKNFDNKIKIDEGKIPIEKIFSQSALIIHSYNSTGFLETMAMNLPTIGFWENGFHDIRPEAVPDFKILLEAGILYFSHIHASNAINHIAKNIDAWWFSEPVQLIRKNFVDKYCINLQKRPQKLKNTLTGLLQASAKEVLS